MPTSHHLLRKALSVIAICAALIGVGAACEPVVPGVGTIVRPKANATWYIQLDGAIDMNRNVDVYDVDGYTTSAATVQALKNQGRFVVCYIDLGSIENYRPDYGDFASSVLSNKNPEWPDEQWLDILRLDVPGPTGKTARQLLQARMDMCKQKGFDAIDPDMIEVYAATGVKFTPAERTITAADQLTFNRWIASEAHARGMAAGLKGDIDQAPELATDFDFVVNEECHHYNECGQLANFVKAGKSVLNIEYAGSDANFTSKVCPQAKSEGIFSVKKKLSLNAWTLDCPK